MPIPHKFFQKIEEKEILLNSFYGHYVTLIPRQRHDRKKKSINQCPSGSYAEILIKILGNNKITNGIQQYNKKLIHHD